MFNIPFTLNVSCVQLLLLATFCKTAVRQSIPPREACLGAFLQRRTGLHLTIYQVYTIVRGQSSQQRAAVALSHHVLFHPIFSQYSLENKGLNWMWNGPIFYSFARCSLQKYIIAAEKLNHLAFQEWGLEFPPESYLPRGLNHFSGQRVL